MRQSIEIHFFDFFYWKYQMIQEKIVSLQIENIVRFGLSKM